LDTTMHPVKFTPLHLHTHYSLLDGLSKPSRVAERCSELGYDTCAITDHGTISGAVSFVRAMREKDIKPILGCEFYLTVSEPATVKEKTNRTLSHLVVLAKNKDGWDSLIELASRSNKDDVFYFKPRIDLDILEEHNAGKNLVSFSGHLGSDLANVLFIDWKQAYNSDSYEEAQKLLKPDWLEQASNFAERYQQIFRKGNFFIEIQLIDQENSPASKLVGECLRQVSKETGIPPVATADSHYPRREDAADQRILLCSAMKTTLKQVEDKLRSGEDVGLSGFFRSNNFHIPSSEEMGELHTEEEITNTSVIADACEDYDILGKPNLPKFGCPNQMAEEEYLRDLCRDGWRKRLKKRGKVSTKETETLYADRIKQELRVIKEANLSGYFLIVRDIVSYVKSQGWLPGPGRGSAAGCLVSYLVGITQVDPIEYGLIFERFYNVGRNTDGHISLPDIDIDVPATKRDEVIDYIKSKYGHTNVSQMVTFGRLQGRSALKEVLRVHGACSYDEMNRITKSLPQEHEISDQLQDMEESSVIRWTLMNQPDVLKDYCKINKNGSLEGQYAKLFEQAIRIEGTYKSQGKHAAGVVISSRNLSEVCPMVRETKGAERIAGMEMTDLESMGHVKFDILGVNLLDKIMGISNQLLTGNIEDNNEEALSSNSGRRMCGGKRETVPVSN
jgi:DNA polymerase-3 subunit alpha